MESIPRAKHSRTRKEEEEEDEGMSKLSDEIVEYIISLLPAIDAARTTVLSRRWRKLYTNTIVFNPNLVFVQNRIKSDSIYELMVEWVNRTIGLHRAPTIDELTVRVCVPNHHSDSVNRWVAFAAEKRVRKLNLNILHFGKNRLNFRHNCRWFSISRGLYWWRLSECLLSRVNVDDTDVECLLSNSPNLEVLFLRDLDTIRYLNIDNNAPRLETLKICRCKGMKNLHIVSAHSLKYLYISNWEIKVYSPSRNDLLPKDCIRISNAPSLESIRLCAFLYGDNPFAHFPPLPSLNYVSFGIDSPYYNYPVHCLVELITHFHHVKRLRIDFLSRVALKIQNHQFPNQFPNEFTNLEHLEVTIRCILGVDTLVWLCHLVKAAPLLSNLSIKLTYIELLYPTCSCNVRLMDIDLKWKDEDIHNKVKANISHLHPCLKVVEVFGFAGYRYQVELVLHLVEIAVSLEKIILDVSVPWDYCEDGILMFNKNQHAEESLACAQLLKTVIRAGIDVLITKHPADSPLKLSSSPSYHCQFGP